MNIFGGWINQDTIITLNKNNNNIPLSYLYINFNDFASGFLSFFAIMTNNNWQFVMLEFSD